MESKDGFSKKTSPKDSSSPFTVRINNRLSVRLYQDCRPKCLETSPLQKGLVLLLNGKELTEEGVGFGVPVAKYEDKTYFAGSANSWILKEKDNPTLVKSYSLDMISRKRLGTGIFVNDRLYHFLHRAFEMGYLNCQGLAEVANKIMELRKALKINTEFEKVKPRGTVTCKYSCKPYTIEITIELSLTEPDRCKEIVILNEQGSTFFGRYTDSAGLTLRDRKIGAWTKIIAGEASFSDTKKTLTFTIKNKTPASLFRGWEKTRGRLSWAGLAYSLPPTKSIFRYSIELNLEE